VSYGSHWEREFRGANRLGHQRWDIENYGFNELANEWHSDHVFRHDPGAISLRTKSFNSLIPTSSSLRCGIAAYWPTRLMLDCGGA
jgi:hypothetical protein